MPTVARVGDMEIIAVTDGEAPPVDPTRPFPDVPATDWKDHRYALDEHGMHRSNFGAMVIKTAGATVLVDTGLGPHAPARYGQPPAQLPRSLSETGVDPGEISAVFLTHLHYDHVGWAMAEDGASPLFQHARYITSKADWEFWMSREDGEYEEHVNIFNSRLAPLMEHGVLELVDGEFTVAPGVRTLPTPGHTPGHMSVLLESGGVRGVVTGDVFHSAAQFAEPHWSHRADVDPVAARETRVSMLERLIPGMVIASGHLLHGSNIGTVAIVEGRRYWRGIGTLSGEITP